MTAGERSEAGVEVVEARIDQVKRGDRGVPCVGDVAMALTAGADAVGSPKVIACGVEECVAFTLEGGLARSLPDQEAGVLEPAAEMRLPRSGVGGGRSWRARRFRAGPQRRGRRRPCRVSRAGRGSAGCRRCAADDCADSFHWANAVSREGRWRLPGHPRIDDVVDVIPLRRAHQVGGPIELWERSEEGRRRVGNCSAGEAHKSGDSYFPV